MVLLALAWVLVPSRPERLIEAGRLDEARVAIQALEERRGSDDDEVLYLQGRLEEERWHRGQTGPRETFRLYGRALGVGSSAAARALARQGESTDCGTRRLAAHALSDSHSRKAISALRDIAASEAEEPETKDPVEKVRRIFGGGGRCGAGDVARDGLRAIEEAS
jgi:ATP/maltotriose-dependent transcriptional regulator MalT